MRLITAAALITATALTWAQQSEHEYEFETIQGNRIAWSCEGDTEPTIVLIAGMGLSAHPSFDRVYHNYDGSGRICMYDRAGLGKSTFDHPHTRTMAELVEELTVLVQRQKWGPLVLVPHSFGGFIAQAYTAENPADVIGILFLDVGHVDWVPAMEAQMSEADWAIMERIIAWNEREFHEDYLEGQEAARAAKLPGQLPITVVSRGVPHTQIRLEKMSYEGIDIYERTHQELQYDLVGLTGDARHRYARVASHLINEYDPWLVIDEIESLVARIEKVR